MTNNDREQFQGWRIYFIHNLGEPHFIDFAARCGMDPWNLLDTIETGIRTRHHEATATPSQGHPRTIWKLTLETVSFYYQLLDGDIEVGDIVCLQDGLAFEPVNDLLAEFTA